TYGRICRLSVCKIVVWYNNCMPTQNRQPFCASGRFRLKNVLASVGLACSLALLLTAANSAQVKSKSRRSSRAVAQKPGYASVMAPLVKKYCAGCHSAGVKSGGIVLTSFRSEERRVGKEGGSKCSR